MPNAEGYDLVEGLPDDGSRQQEVYACFGLCAYGAQTFEIGLVNLLFVDDLERSLAMSPGSTSASRR